MRSLANCNFTFQIDILIIPPYTTQSISHLCQPSEREILKGQMRLFSDRISSGVALLLTLVDPGRCNGRKGHPVPEEHDDVLSLALDERLVQFVLELAESDMLPIVGFCKERKICGSNEAMHVCFFVFFD